MFCCTFHTNVIILTATNAQFLPLQVCVVLASTKIIKNLLHIVQQQIDSVISLGGWRLVRVNWVVKVVSICRHNKHGELGKSLHVYLGLAECILNRQTSILSWHSRAIPVSHLVKLSVQRGIAGDF
jgi:hypothetical protein